jgi:hypothetical protein
LISIKKQNKWINEFKLLNLDRVKPNEFKMKEDACINCEKKILKRYTHIMKWSFIFRRRYKGNNWIN